MNVAERAVTCAAAALLGGCCLANAGDPATGPGRMLPLTVATYNIEGGRDSRLMLQNLRRFHADVICLQEVTDPPTTLTPWAAALKMNRVFAGYSPQNRSGCAILARGTLKLLRVLTMPGERNFGLVADLTVDGVHVTVICIHLKSLPRPLLEGALTSMGPRSQQARQVVRLAEKSPFPVIVAGDTNSLPVFPSYVTLRSALDDCCVRTGTTSQPTILVNEMGYRIDHVFTRGPWQVRSCRVLSLTGSDHRPVVAQLLLNVPPATQPSDETYKQQEKR